MPWYGEQKKLDMNSCVCVIASAFHDLVNLGIELVGDLIIYFNWQLKL